MEQPDSSHRQRHRPDGPLRKRIAHHRLVRLALGLCGRRVLRLQRHLHRNGSDHDRWRRDVTRQSVPYGSGLLTAVSCAPSDCVAVGFDSVDTIEGPMSVGVALTSRRRWRHLDQRAASGRCRRPFRRIVRLVVGLHGGWLWQLWWRRRDHDGWWRDVDQLGTAGREPRIAHGHLVLVAFGLYGGWRWQPGRCRPHDHSARGHYLDQHVDPDDSAISPGSRVPRSLCARRRAAGPEAAVSSSPTAGMRSTSHPRKRVLVGGRRWRRVRI